MLNIVDDILVGYSGSEDVLVLPENIKGINTLVFRNALNLRVVDLSNTKIENLSTKAFFECKNVEKIILPDCLKTIGYQVFSNCMNLEEINLPNGLESIGAGSFEECISLITFSLPDSIKEIEMNMFKGCSKLERIEMSEELISIGESAFENCLNLNNIAFPDSLRKLGMFAFRNCRNIMGISIPKNVRIIPRGCFYKCTRLSIVILNDTLEKIDDWAFRECTMLDKVAIPKTTKVSPCAFLDSKTVNEPKFEDYVKVPKKQKCYIATCVYKSYETRELYVLRRYRDKKLRRTWYGRLFIRWYYFNAPIAIKLFGKTKWFNKLFKKYLDNKVKKLISKGYLDEYYEDI